MNVQCCVCRKIRVQGEWTPDKATDFSVEDSYKFSHGYCPPCAEREMKHFRRQMSGSALVPRCAGTV